MSEKLDPEETKEIMGKVFGEISKVVFRYDGFIEKFIGDAVMALFGAATSTKMIRSGQSRPPERSMKSFLPSVHNMKRESASPVHAHRHLHRSCGYREVNLEKGTHGVLGDTINTASRLSGLAKPEKLLSAPIHTIRRRVFHL